MSRLGLMAALALVSGVGCILPEDWDQDGYNENVDCKDNDAFVHPDAEEWCNGVDDDCDGQIDEDTEPNNRFQQAVYYVDDDGDGYGQDNNYEIRCGGPVTGFAFEPGDCDDADWRVKPGGTGCGGGVDFNCDGAPEAECDPWIEPDISTVDAVADTWFLGTGDVVQVGEYSGQYAVITGGGDSGGGVSVLLEGNHTPATTIDGERTAQDEVYLSGFDRYGDDLLIAAPASLTPKGDGGVVVIGYQSAVGSTLVPSAAPIFHTEDLPGWGTAVATIDPDASGAPTLAASAPAAAVVSLMEYDPTPPTWTEHSRLSGSDELGTALQAIDLDGDGLAEVIAGAPGGNGGVWLIEGDTTVGTSDVASVGTFLAGSGGRAGANLVDLGDITGDGTSDLGVPTEDGRVYIVSVGATTALSDGIELTDLTGDRQRVVAGGDLDGDGIEDLLVGQPDRHRVTLIPGPLASGEMQPTQTIVGPTPENTLGSVTGEVLWRPGDIDGDGYDDLGYRVSVYLNVLKGPL